MRIIITRRGNIGTISFTFESREDVPAKDFCVPGEIVIQDSDIPEDGAHLIVPTEEAIKFHIG